MVLHNDRTSVESALRQCLQACFRLTDDTPFLQEPLRSSLGILGDSEAAQWILDGTYDIPAGLSDTTCIYILLLDSPLTPLPEIDVSILCDTWQSYWKRAKEKTSSPMSGLHFGHYKAAVDSNYISEIHSSITETAFAWGCSIPRWQQGLQVMLEKKPGVRNVEKLRAILLM
jgi:hypothetical protein